MWPALLFSFRFRVLGKLSDPNLHLLSASSGCSAAVRRGADCTDPSQLLAKAGEGHFASGRHGHGASPSEPHWVSPIQKGQQTQSLQKEAQGRETKQEQKEVINNNN